MGALGGLVEDDCISLVDEGKEELERVLKQQRDELEERFNEKKDEVLTAVGEPLGLSFEATNRVKEPPTNTVACWAKLLAYYDFISCKVHTS